MSILGTKSDAPCLVLPFKQQSLLEIYESECWVFTMGDAMFQTTSEATIADPRFHEAFLLKV